MDESAHRTVKFPKVAPVKSAPPPPGAVAPDAPEPAAHRPSRPSADPEWYEDESGLQRNTPIVGADPADLSSPDRPLLKVLVGLNAGQVFTLDRAETVVGCARDADIRIEDAGVSRKHARISLTEGGRYVIEDLGSTNGVFVNKRLVDRAVLADGDRVQLGPAHVLQFAMVAADEEVLARNLYDGSTRDALTRLYNRRYASERLAMEVAYAHRHGTLLSLLFLDVDHFKRVNDTFGHVAGDAVLCVIAAQAQKAIRSEDVLARYGGEEFVVLVRGIDAKSVGVIAGRIRRGIERLSIPWASQIIKTTVSIGVASLADCEPNATAEALVTLADERLYRAKESGRNRVC
jgi:diguanylate cyclase (GGDEF)-like protein